jgi:hypothetical protein
MRPVKGKKGLILCSGKVKLSRAETVCGWVSVLLFFYLVGGVYMCVLKDPQPYDRLISYEEGGGEPLNGKTSIQKIGIKAGASPRPYHTSYAGGIEKLRKFTNSI